MLTKIAFGYSCSMNDSARNEVPWLYRDHLTPVNQTILSFYTCRLGYFNMGSRSWTYYLCPEKVLRLGFLRRLGTLQFYHEVRRFYLVDVLFMSRTTGQKKISGVTHKMWTKWPRRMSRFCYVRKGKNRHLRPSLSETVGKLPFYPQISVEVSSWKTPVQRKQYLPW